MSPHGKDQLWLLALGGVLFFANLGAAPLWDRDEPRNAGCTAEMLQQNEFVVPIFNDELRTHKPILLYWLMMISYSIFGINEFGARAVSAFCGLGTLLLTYRIAYVLFDQHVARWAGTILASTLMFCVASRFATPDSLLIFCSALAIYFFVRGGGWAPRTDTSPASVREWMPRGWNLIGMYGAMGLGLLAKGPVGLVLPTAVIGMYLLIAGLPTATRCPNGSLSQRIVGILRPFRPAHFLRTCWQMRPVTAIAIAGLVAGPWYAWVHLRTGGAWTREFFWIHNVSRASDTMEGHAGPPVLFYVVAILIGFFPWSIITIPATITIGKSKKTTAQRMAFTFLACWVAVYIGIFSIAKTKLPSYVTPCYPAIAIALGYFMNSWRYERAVIYKGWLKVGLAHWLVIGLIFLMGLPLAAQRWLPGSQWLAWIGCVPCIGGVICWHAINKRQHGVATYSFATTAIAFAAICMMCIPAEIGHHREDNLILGKIRQHAGPVVSYAHLEPSWIFYGGKPIHEFKSEETHALVSHLRANPDVMLITTDQRLADLRKTTEFPETFRTVQQAPYFLRNRGLLALESVSSQPIAQRLENAPAR